MGKEMLEFEKNISILNLKITLRLLSINTSLYNPRKLIQGENERQIEVIDILENTNLEMKIPVLIEKIKTLG